MRRAIEMAATPNHLPDTRPPARRERPEMSYLLYPFAIAIAAFGSTLAFV